MRCELEVSDGHPDRGVRSDRVHRRADRSRARGAGATPLLAGRDADRVARLAAELGLETTVADVDRPGSVRALVERGDVLATTVGPYLRFREPALEAAVDAGAHYFDATGEGPFIRRVFDDYGGAGAAGRLRAADGVRVRLRPRQPRRRVSPS
jgi:short subunit dehydrogenase-like uncharacterized protein